MIARPAGTLPLATVVRSVLSPAALLAVNLVVVFRDKLFRKAV